MFKNGQLVKTINGIYGVIEKESTVYRGAYIVRSRRGNALSKVCYRPNELTLIGNNFKLKEAK